MAPESRSARAELARALRALNEAAGSPSGRVLKKEGEGARPRVGLAPSSICEWLSGTSVPKDPVAFAFLIARLEARARPRSPGFRFRTGRQWESLRLEARAERRGGGSRGGVTGASTATSPSARLSAPSDHEVAEAVTRYARRVVEEFGGWTWRCSRPSVTSIPRFDCRRCSLLRRCGRTRRRWNCRGSCRGG